MRFLLTTLVIISVLVSCRFVDPAVADPGRDSSRRQITLPADGRVEGGTMVRADLRSMRSSVTERFPGATGDSYRVDLLGRWASGPCSDAAVVGSTAYMLDGGQMEIVDCSDPSSPVGMGHLWLPSSGLGIAVSGSFAYVADGDDGLRVIDVTEPAHPSEVGFYDFWDRAMAVAVSGSHAYLAVYSDGLRVIDVSDPTSPTEVGSWDTGAYARDVVISGNYAYIANAGVSGGFVVIDVSDPTSPTEVGSCWAGEYLTCVAVSGNYAYVTDDVPFLYVVNVSDPTNPTVVARHYPGGEVEVAGHYAYVAWGDLHVLDVSDPAYPVEVGSCDTEGHALRVAVSESYAYVADLHGGLRVINAGDPAHPVEVGFYGTADYVRGLAISGEYTSGEYAYVADGYGGLRVIDVSDPAHPVEVGFCRTGDSARSVAVSGDFAFVDYVFVADYSAGLRVIDVSDPTSPIEVGFCDTGGSAVGVAVSGNCAFVADDNRGLRVIDVRYPTSLVEVGYCHTGGATVGVAVSGHYAFVADNNRGLCVIDVSAPAFPVEVGFYNTSSAKGVSVSGDYAYLVGGFGLRVIDVSDPTNPTQVGLYDTEDDSWGVAISGSHAYVADRRGGLRVINVSDPAFPIEVGFYDPGGWVLGVAVSGNHAYVVDFLSGLYVLECTRAVPVMLQHMAASFTPEGVRIDWEVADEIDITMYSIYRALSGEGSSVPVLRASIAAERTRQYSYLDADVLNGEGYRYTLVAREENGTEWQLGSRDVTTGASPILSLEQNVPNPFNPTTTISFVLPERTRAMLAIYDVEGRHVRTLVDEVLNGGLNGTTWDGTDAQGHRVSSGVYLYRLEVGNQTITKKLTILK